MRQFYLVPTRQKSYYGKAVVIERLNGIICLRSYDTIVCYIGLDGRFVRTWGGYSATTMKHINDFIDFYNINGGGKKWWLSLPVENI